MSALVFIRESHGAVSLTGWGGFMFFLLLIALMEGRK